MVGVLVVGFLANLAVRPVPERFHEQHDGEPVRRHETVDLRSHEKASRR